MHILVVLENNAGILAWAPPTRTYDGPKYMEDSHRCSHNAQAAHTSLVPPSTSRFTKLKIINTKYRIPHNLWKNQKHPTKKTYMFIIALLRIPQDLLRIGTWELLTRTYDGPKHMWMCQRCWQKASPELTTSRSHPTSITNIHGMEEQPLCASWTDSRRPIWQSCKYAANKKKKNPATIEATWFYSTNHLEASW